MFFAGILVLWSLAHAYVAWHLSGAWPLQGRVRRRRVALAALGLWALLPLARLASWAGLIEWFGMHWLGVMILLTLCLLLHDALAVLALPVLRRRLLGLLPRTRAVALAAGLLLSGLALAQGLRAPVVSEHEVRLAGLPPEADGLRLVALSDLHLGGLLGREWLQARLAQVRALEPDVVVLLGDLVEGHSEAPDELLQDLRGLAPALGVWAVLGNHDNHGDPEQVVRALERAGVRVLRDGWRELRPGLLLAGLEDSGHMGRGLAPGRLGVALAGRPAGAATILLSHRPQGEEEAAAAGVGLMLAGHTHGGQIWPLGYLTRLGFPRLAGRFELGGMTLLVSRGTGTWGPRMRLWPPGEILRVVLRPA
ncbi:MAG TPA: metallophosphoesterase [Myxococcota bacterium]|nr:metallophosphoesterase [Myxococcota bacterium]HRY94528.1 metallophosphoesterase [Myxococcota bacterium]HSA20027.1 metallophosphoesterase [Myxococcota bacterium]